MRKIRNVAIFASGDGTNVEKIIQHQLNNDTRYRVRVIITDNEISDVIKYAKEYNIPHIVNSDPKELNGLFKGLEIEVISVSYYKKPLPSEISDEYYTINIHPSLLPKHKDLYGDDIHRSVIKSDEDKSGMTIHHVTSGKILYYNELSISTGDTPLSLKKRIQVLEHKFYPIVLDEVCRTLENIQLETYTH